MKFCPKCGTELTEGAKFCPKCGYKLDASTEAKPATTVNDEKPAASKPAKVKKNTEKKAQSKKPAKPHKKFKYTKWIVAAVIIIIAVVVGYRQAYVPHAVKSSLAANDFTSEHGYTSSVNFSKHEIVLVASDDNLNKYMKELAANEYDTRKINIENQLSGLAHDVSSKTFGTWEIAIAAKTNQGASVLWEYDGTKETKRFQTSSQGKELRQEYLEKQEEAEQQAEEEDRDEKIGAGLLGGGIGLLIGGL